MFKPKVSFQKFRLFRGNSVVGYAILNYFVTGSGRKANIMFSFKKKTDPTKYKIDLPLSALKELFSIISADGYIKKQPKKKGSYRVVFWDEELQTKIPGEKKG